MSKRFYYDEFCEDIFDDEIQQYPSNQTICNILNQQQEQIAELKEKLAESEKKYENRKQFFIGEIRSQMEIINNLLKENEKLKKQLAEKDERYVQGLIKLEKEYDEQLEKQAKIHYRHLKEKDQDKISFAIDELSKVNGILTETIIEVTQDEFDLNKLCYLEEISAKFSEKIDNQIKAIKGAKQ